MQKLSLPIWGRKAHSVLMVANTLDPETVRSFFDSSLRVLAKRPDIYRGGPRFLEFESLTPRVSGILEIAHFSIFYPALISRAQTGPG